MLEVRNTSPGCALKEKVSESLSLLSSEHVLFVFDNDPSLFITNRVLSVCI